ncbi:MAG: Holliday junction branch migration DNA helicase RuvB [Planctomycetes bacterium]|nr:Holliday junction branch migration DNA helicase RuvB [Planctomycetota bacterium]
MATERLLTATATTPEDERLSHSLRPESLGEFVGQQELIERLTISLKAAKMRGDAMEHLLLHGPPGLGKTTLAHVIAREMGTRVRLESGPTLAKPMDLVAALSTLQHGDVLFIDEIHRMPITVEEFIYPAMEDCRIEVRVDSGMNAQTVHMKLKPFTLVGATTRKGLISSPLQTRFGLDMHFRLYTQGELRDILSRSASLLGMGVNEESLNLIASRARGTPRIANRLLRRVRDFAAVRNKGTVTPAVVDASLKLEGVDERGMDELDRKYLRTLADVYGGGPAGLNAMAATMNEDPGTVEVVVEPFLLQCGMIAITPRGRALTRPGAELMGVSYRETREMGGISGGPTTSLFAG